MKYNIFSFFVMCIISFVIFLWGCEKDEIINIDNRSGEKYLSVSSFPIRERAYGWEKVPLNSNVSSFAFDSRGNLYFINSKKLYCANESFIIKDSLEIPLENGRVYPGEIYINGNDVFFYTGYNGLYLVLYVSEDKGKNWYKPDSFKETQIENFFSKGNRVYITSSGHDESVPMVQWSEDNGKTWHKLISRRGFTGFYFCAENNMNEIFFTKTDTMFYSSDYGITLVKRKLNFANAQYNSVAFGYNKTVVVGSLGGVYTTKDYGLTWQCIYNNADLKYYYRVFNSNNGFLYSMRLGWSYYGMEGVYSSRDGGLTWYNYLSAPPENYSEIYRLGKDDHLYIICGTDNKYCLYRSKVKL